MGFIVVQYQEAKVVLRKKKERSKSSNSMYPEVYENNWCL